VIAHRLPTIVSADKIVVMDQGFNRLSKERIKLVESLENGYYKEPFITRSFSVAN
jgi:ABC-type transport system involved in Fe-S cluster assembly fused permease/ATPase subunit